MRVMYGVLVAFVIVQRLVELGISKRNQRALSAQGFSEVERPSDLGLMIAVHTGWFVGLALEPLIAPKPIFPAVALLALVLFVGAQSLRVWAIVSLRQHWNISVFNTSKGSNLEQVVASGPYRFIRHPNYLAVIVEFLSLPLVGGAYVTMVLFTILNGLVLVRRIRTEEEALGTRPGYADNIGMLPRFIPWPRH